MHKDQKRIVDALLPRILAAAFTTSTETERDCTVMNRLFLQGPDPLYLMETSPLAFSFLCDRLNLTYDDGRQAILDAHERGPAVLLDELRGIPVDPWVSDFHSRWNDRREWRREGLWLLLASFSDCTEDEYKPSMTLLDRIQRATAASVRFERYVSSGYSTQPHWDALARLAVFENTTKLVLDERGFPNVTNDIGFYIAYKAGHKVCVYNAASGLKFYGTVPSTSLDEQAILVDKKISPQYGIVFPPEPEPSKEEKMDSYVAHEIASGNLPDAPIKGTDDDSDLLSYRNDRS